MSNRLIPAWTPAISAVALGALITPYYVLLFGTPSSRADPPDLQMLQGKLQWASAAILLDVALIMAFLLTIVVMTELRAGLHSWQFNVVATFLGAALVALGWLAVNRHIEDDATTVLFKRIMNEVDGIHILISIHDVAGILTVGVLVIACSLATVGIENCDASSLRQRMELYRATLFCGVFLLAAGVFEIFRLGQWEALLSNHDTAKMLASAYAVSTGVVFSCLMIIMFLPPAMRLNNHMAHLISAAALVEPQFDQKRWTTEHKFDNPPLNQFARYFAFILPALVGLLTKVLEASL